MVSNNNHCIGFGRASRKACCLGTEGSSGWKAKLMAFTTVHNAFLELRSSMSPSHRAFEPTCMSFTAKVRVFRRERKLGEGGDLQSLKRIARTGNTQALQMTEKDLRFALSKSCCASTRLMTAGTAIGCVRGSGLAGRCSNFRLSRFTSLSKCLSPVAFFSSSSFAFLRTAIVGSAKVLAPECVRMH